MSNQGGPTLHESIAEAVSRFPVAARQTSAVPPKYVPEPRDLLYLKTLVGRVINPSELLFDETAIRYIVGPDLGLEAVAHFHRIKNKL